MITPRVLEPDSEEASEFLQGVYLVPTEEEDLGVQAADRKTTTVLLVKDAEGQLVLPIFSTEMDLLRWRPQGCRYFGMEGKAILDELAGSTWHRLVLDGASDNVIAVTRSMAQKILKLDHYEIPPKSQMEIVPISPPLPDSFLTELRSACEAATAIKEAFVFLLEVDGDGPEFPTLGLRLDASGDGEAQQAVVNGISSSIDPAEFGVRALDITFLHGDLLEQARATVPWLVQR